MGFHLIDDAFLKEITDAIRYRNVIGENQPINGSDLPTLIRDEGKLKKFFSGEADTDENGDPVLLEIGPELLDGLTSVRSYIFFGIKWVKKIVLPESLARLGNNPFNQCNNLEEIHLSSKQTALGTQACANCFKLEKINVENIKTIGSSCFNRNYVLPKLDFHRLEKIDDAAFSQCFALKTLIIRTNKVCQLVSSAAFQASLIQTGTEEDDGYIYVPQNLLESYKSATNWEVYKHKIRAIEAYPHICGEVVNS